MAASLSRCAGGGGRTDDGVVRAASSPGSSGTKAEGCGVHWGAVPRSLVQTAAQQAGGAGDFEVSAGAAGFFVGFGRDHCMGENRPRGGRSAHSRARGMACARSFPRRQAGSARILAASGGHVPGAGSYLARRGTAEFPHPDYRRGWQGWCPAQDVTWSMVARRYTGTDNGGFLMSELPWAPEVVDSHTDQQPDQPAAEPGTLAMSLDDFSSLEDRILRAVNLVKRERLARAAAEERAS